ncbi:hypothetical protein F5X68DRAFT_280010 [Plectosphaerella plurivora]|uniref:Uncharacterized protein n=1 Tax=Plectosphaerella plurivora TaxID=936078 RepID=A0A9P8UZK0_9PEZI|nr:hypothetical protein F5X68DRAFT_280010 [Plectosphaerella plurivora]
MASPMELTTGGYLEAPSNNEHVAAVGLLQLAVSNVPQLVLKKQQFYDRKIYSPTLFSEEHGTVYITSVLADVLAIKKDTHHSLSFYSQNIDVLVSQNGFVWQLEAVDRATRSVLDASTFWQDPDTKEQVMDRCALTLLADYSKTKGFTAAEWLELMARSGMRHQMVYYSKDLQRSYTLSDILGIDKATQEFHFSIQKDATQPKIDLGSLSPASRSIVVYGDEESSNEERDGDYHGEEDEERRQLYSESDFEHPLLQIVASLITAGIARSLTVDPRVVKRMSLQDLCMKATGDISCVYGYQDIVGNPLQLARDMAVPAKENQGN